MRKLFKFKKKVNIVYINKTLLIFAGIKHELYIIFKMFSGKNISTYKKIKPIFK